MAHFKHKDLHLCDRNGRLLAMKKPAFDWISGTFLIGYQLLLLIGLPFYFYYNSPSLTLVFLSAALVYITGMSVTGGYHRLFSHKTYKAKPVVETVLLFFSAMAMQSSALRWSFDHRRHHAHVDTDADPYSIKKGFWHAHFTWMLYKPDPIDPKLVSDLMKNPRVMFQHKYIAPLMFGTNALMWAFIGWIFNDYLGAFVIATALRIFTLHHLTWFINSLAHTWGDKPFCQEQSAVNNLVLSFLTFGEGYHNYHHTYANDYRNGIRWFHFDPTKWLIWTLSKFGLAKSLRKMDNATIKKRLITERKNLLLNKLSELNHQELTTEVESHAEKLLSTMRERMLTKEEWKQWQHLSKRIFSISRSPSTS